jgi:hypothetical protein
VSGNQGLGNRGLWQRVRAGLPDLLRAHGAVDVRLQMGAEPPQANPRSGKLQHVLRFLPVRD